MYARQADLKINIQGASTLSDLTESVPSGGRANSQRKGIVFSRLHMKMNLIDFTDMFQNARNFNISGGEFNIQYLLHNFSREESVSWQWPIP